MKKLTPQQVRFIDDYLIKNKVKYWDVRIELIDHIANLLEEKLNNGVSFEDAMLKVHREFGNRIGAWVLNKEKTEWIQSKTIYDDNKGFKLLILEKREALKRKIRQSFKKELKTLFVNPFFLTVYILLLVAIKYNIERLGAEQLFYITTFPVTFFTVYLIYIGLKNRKKQRALITETVVSFLLSLLLIIMQTPNIIRNMLGYDFSKTIQWSAFILFFPLVFALFVVLKKIVKKQDKVYKQYIAQ